MIADIRDQTERALWETRNIILCLKDAALWEKPYCGAPAWQHAYHMLHSLERWYINPERYQQPAFHTEGLDDLDRPASTALAPEQLLCYHEQISRKLRQYLDTLTADELERCPEGCRWTRLTLILAQMRHLHSHMGMLMGFLIADKEKWPFVLGLTRPLPEEPQPLYF